MADVRPFRGLHYNRSIVADLGAVVCPPYDVVDAAGERRLLDRDPNNAVRVELTTVSVAGGPAERYERAAETLRNWQAQGVLVRDEAPAFYLHEATFEVDGRTRSRRELIAAVRLEPWDRRVVLPHEHTFDRPKADRFRLLEATATNLSPVLSFFQRELGCDDAVEAAWRWAATRAPIGEGTDADGVGHRLWALPVGDVADALTAFFADRPLFIADGHHRYETALHYLETRRRAAGGDLPTDHPARFVLMHLIAEDDPGLVILPLHRLIGGAGREALSAFVSQLGETFTVDVRQESANAARIDAVVAELRERGAREHAFGLLGPEAFTMVVLSRPVGAPPATGVAPDRDPSWQALDVVVADAAIVRPLLAGNALDVEDALDYTRDAHDAVARVSGGAADVAVLVNPTRVEQIAAVALAGERMPEKSTYFYPKAPTGLVFRPLTDA